ncbi:ImmA/IrrE family metallo-endopeptidase [Halomonas saccharevitans]|uniref:ImmA/IrrE family metallo-endopeptidase n=1 Tax=Halomonas saccharevitans TaxID=416872 RepID=A0ABU3NIN9_9GAMM|nr:ImmA/IrrE family metallo-endopeptidase [Halomonas saccharevitans]MDT8880102.1 ImmA/IrrE family metallo-endopeptidase [Halomonas saccharevitans]
MAFIKRSERKSRKPPEFEDLTTPEDLIALAEKKGLETNPVSVSELASELGISVRFEPMPDDDSGSLKKERKTGNWIMTVNSLHHPHRQRFTIAHEIAHRIRHAANSDSFEDKTFFRNGESNWMEAEANQFAAALLMPEKYFNYFIENESSTVEDVAKYFQVSSMAVRIRAKNLGYEGHNL